MTQPFGLMDSLLPFLIASLGLTSLFCFKFLKQLEIEYFWTSKKLKYL